MQISAKEIALIIGGEVDGNPDVIISKPSKIEEGEKGSITFLANPKYTPFVYKTNASAVIVPRTFAPEKPVQTTLIRVHDVYASIGALLHEFNHSAIVPSGISKMADISPDAKVGTNLTVGSFSVISAKASIGENVVIYPQVYVGSNVRIGNNVMIYPGVRIYHDCIIGDNCIVHSNTVIGSDGFGFSNTDGEFKKIPHVGNVEIRNNVEIGANVTIDRATMGSTIIGEGVKLDNLIQIAHNVVIDKNSGLAAQTGVAGSSKIGKNVMIGGQAGVAGHLNIADGTKIAAQSGINSNITEKNTAVFGSPAIEYTKYLKSYALFKKLPELQQRIVELEKKLKDLTSETDVQ